MYNATPSRRRKRKSRIRFSGSPCSDRHRGAPLLHGGGLIPVGRIVPSKGTQPLAVAEYQGFYCPFRHRLRSFALRGLDRFKPAVPKEQEHGKPYDRSSTWWCRKVTGTTTRPVGVYLVVGAVLAIASEAPILDLAQGQALLDRHLRWLATSPPEPISMPFLWPSPGQICASSAGSSFYLPGILNRDACTALAFLTRPSPCIPLSNSVRGVCWVEPRLIATVKHFGRAGGGATSRRCTARARCRIDRVIADSPSEASWCPLPSGRG
jgi:hypothetical protein